MPLRQRMLDEFRARAKRFPAEAGTTSRYFYFFFAFLTAFGLAFGAGFAAFFLPAGFAVALELFLP